MWLDTILFILHRARDSAFSVELLHLPLLLTMMLTLEGGQYLSSTGWNTLSSVDPSIPGSAASQELCCSWARGAILWTADLLRGSSMIGENRKSHCSEPVCSACGFLSADWEM